MEGRRASWWRTSGATPYSRRSTGDERARLAYTQLVRSWRRSCGAMIGSLGGVVLVVASREEVEAAREVRRVLCNPK